MQAVLFPNFLEDEAEYDSSEKFWVDLWNQTDPFDRDEFRWSYPWVGTGSPLIKDANPIFSARSRLLRRGVRIIQLEPLGPDLDFQVWLDTFGGGVKDPRSINELVIACVLSVESSKIALDLMSQWIQDSQVSIDYRDYVASERGRRSEYGMFALDFAA